jgi:D-glycero-alpha-D-manno-heptose 1-phosphate guanylyltransferase
MAPVAGKPFLYYLISFLHKNGIEKFIFSVGYLHEIIEDYLQKTFPALQYKISLENEPLGTGGAIKLACSQTTEKNVLICNGDTLYKIDLISLSNFHQGKKASCSLTLKPMENFDRYGVVELNKNESVKTFREKQFYNSGLINGGVYALNIPQFLKEDLPEKFSFEKDFLEKKVCLPEDNCSLFGLIQDKYFIDIGIPEDFARAQNEFKNYQQAT